MKKHGHNLILISLVVVLSSSVTLVSCGKDTPDPSLNWAFFNTSHFNASYPLMEMSSNIYLTQMLNFVFTGTYDGSGSSNEDLLDDDTTLDALLDLAILFIAANYDESPENYPDNFITEILPHLLNVKDRLSKNGTTAVFYKDIKPYLSYLSPQNLLLLYLAVNGDNAQKNFKKYLADEYYGNQTEECKMHNLLWVQDVQAGELWAMEMLDATAKIPAGIMNLNINWMGSWKECKRIDYDVVFAPNMTTHIAGKYCRVDIGFPIEQIAGDLPIDSSIGLSLGVCVPKTCSNKDVEKSVGNFLKLLNAFQYSWVKHAKCEVEQPKMTTAAIIYFVLIVILVALIVAATCYDIVWVRIMKPSKNARPDVAESSDTPETLKAKKDIAGQNVIKPRSVKNQKADRLEKFIVGCSLYANAEYIFKTSGGGKITCLNGIRALSMLWIIWGHTYNYVTERVYFLLIENIRDLEEFSEEFFAQLILNGMFAVDTFFMMSAFLLTLSFMNHLEKKGRLTAFEWVYFYVNRYWRLLPPFLAIIVIYICLVPYIGFGPLWSIDEFPPRNKMCTTHWWVYPLFLNNFLPNGKGSECMAYLWYIPNDFQFYAISPIFLLILYKFPIAGQTLLGFLLLASLSILGFLTANVYESRFGNIVQVLVDIWEDVYIKPYCRAAPWIIGIYLGYIFFKHKQIKLSKVTVALGWVLSFSMAMASIFVGYINHSPDMKDARMTTSQYALFFASTKLMWPLAVAWVVFACSYGYGGVINRILSYGLFIPLTKLSYCAYLVHPPLMSIYYYAQRNLFHGTYLTLMYVFFGHIVMTFVTAFLFTLIFELPFAALFNFIVAPPRKN